MLFRSQGYAGGNPFPAALSLNAASKFNTFSAWATYPADIKPTVLQQWNVGVQRQATGWLLAASYLGNHTSHLWAGRNINPAVYLPGATTGNTNQRRTLYLQNPVEGQYFGAVSVLDDTGTATYQGMLLSVQRRLRSNLSVLSNWTVSKCVTDYTNTQFSSATTNMDPAHPENDRGYCDQDRRQVINISGVIKTPVLQKWGLFGRIASDWQVSPLVRWTSGGHSTPVTGVDTALTGAANQRALQILDNPYGDGTPGNYVNPAAFAAPAAGTYSAVHPGSIDNPSLLINDMALSRTLRFGAGRTMQLRWEVFNVVNRVNLGAPIVDLNSANFGKIITAGDPRIMQFAVKFDF